MISSKDVGKTMLLNKQLNIVKTKKNNCTQRNWSQSNIIRILKWNTFEII